MAKKDDVKISQPVGPTLADIEILKERIGNMSPEEQAIVASEIHSSILEAELTFRRLEAAKAIHGIAECVRGYSSTWAK